MPAKLPQTSAELFADAHMQTPKKKRKGSRTTSGPPELHLRTVPEIPHILKYTF